MPHSLHFWLYYLLGAQLGAFAILIVLSTGQNIIHISRGNNKNKHGCGNYEIKINTFTYFYMQVNSLYIG